MSLPPHLKKYVVDQNYDRYTPVNQATWRYILRQLVFHLKKAAHPVYVSGLEKTGISIEEIPNIEEMSLKLENFGWKAVPVSGFIPPAAFMEFQSLGYLPIASDMRTASHIMYTPAPDIVHEAAGHAPIIADPEYAEYLKKYAEVASHAIISSEDIALYEAIRELSDAKESPDSTQEDIDKLEKKLIEKTPSYDSEASQLSRMNWWTAEYGLIGEIGNPKIFGAGLLSSPGESKTCFEDSVQKIHLSLDCVNFSYDITERQPQLFVAKSFAHLGDVLEDLANTMAFRKGGKEGLEKAKKAATVNTVELSSGIQISSKLTNVIEKENQVAYLQFTGPTQLSYNKKQLPGHGKDFHLHGYGTAIGKIKDDPNFEVDKEISLEFESGIQVNGKLSSILKKDDKICLLTFEDCKVTDGDNVLFDPEWGIYDLAVGEEVTSVFGGPADRVAYGEVEDFVAKVIPLREYSDDEKRLHKIYQDIRNFRENPEKIDKEQVKQILSDLEDYPSEWLPLLELLEIFEAKDICKDTKSELKDQLQGLTEMNAEASEMILDGLAVIDELPLISK